MPYLAASSDSDVELKVYVQPRASCNRICGLHDGWLKITITSPPVDGKANKALVSFLAKALGVTKSELQLKSGQTSRRKVFQITGKSIEELRGDIESILEG